MAYTIQFKPVALKPFEKLSREAQRRILAKIETLRDEPFPPGCEKMEVVPDAWRLRVGNYRVIYQVRREILLIFVLAVGHGTEAYR